MAVISPISILSSGSEPSKSGQSGANVLTDFSSPQQSFSQTLQKQMLGNTSNQQPSPAKVAVNDRNESVVANANAQTKPAASPQAKSQSTSQSSSQTTQASNKHDVRQSVAREANQTKDVATEAEQVVSEDGLPLVSTEIDLALGIEPLSDAIDTAELVQTIATDPLAAGASLPFSPWVQNMLAMRQEGAAPTDSLEQSAGHNTAGLMGDLLADDPAAHKLIDVATSDDGVSANIADMVKPNVQELALMPDALRMTESDRDIQTFDALLNSASDRQEGINTAMLQSPLLNAGGLTATTSVVASQISVPFANQERWQTAMNQQVMSMVSVGDDVASLTLSPPDLGPVQVVLKVDNQSVNTTFISDNPLVRQALEDGLQDLRQRMQSQGLQLGQTFVGDGQQAQQHFSAHQSGTPSYQGRQASGEEEVADVVTPVPRRVALGAVDTFV